jgi:hypothetical protein
MTADQLDDYLERARLESALTTVPEGFTNRVMRAVSVQPSAPVLPDVFPSTLASGALVMAGAMLMLVSPSNPLAAGTLLALGLLWLWLDDPLAGEIKIRLSPW